MAGDGVAHVKSPSGQLQAGRVAAPFADSLLEMVIEAAEDCPEECIFIEN
jgi:ferredoxin